MSTTDKATTASTENPLFTAKEKDVLEKAWLCLKTGAPDVDMDKLTTMCGFNTKKTASNTWGVIKKKLQTLAPPAAEGEEGEGDGKSSSPKKPTTPGKRKSKAAGGGDDEEQMGGYGASSPVKKRKTPAKKAKEKVKAAEDDVAVKDEEQDSEW